MTGTARATDVQHHRRRCLNETDPENRRCAIDETVMASTNGHSLRDMSAGWCCTFVARGAYEAAGRPSNEAQQSTTACEIGGLQRSRAAT
jgi:hypothetical protein